MSVHSPEENTSASKEPLEAAVSTSVSQSTTAADSTPQHEEDGEISDHDVPATDTQISQTQAGSISDPPLPSEPLPPPLPTEAPPEAQPLDDGWEPVWDAHAQAFYFYNKFTHASQWENPRVPDQPVAVVPGTFNHEEKAQVMDIKPTKRANGYDPSIHGDYDPNADYAKVYDNTTEIDTTMNAPGTDPTDAYAATGTFNRFTGRWQRAELNPENFTDEQKSRRQMNAFFDVDAAANSHDGRSLRAERANKKLSKAELKAFKEKRREKKEEKRRAWLRD